MSVSVTEMKDKEVVEDKETEERGGRVEESR